MDLACRWSSHLYNDLDREKIMLSYKMIRSDLRLAVFTPIFLLINATIGLAQTETADTGQVCDLSVELTCAEDGRVIYHPNFFAQYNPSNAHDIVMRVPGFTMEHV